MQNKHYKTIREFQTEITRRLEEGKGHIDFPWLKASIYQRIEDQYSFMREIKEMKTQAELEKAGQL